MPDNNRNIIPLKIWDADDNGVFRTLLYDRDQEKYALTAEKNGVQETITATRPWTPPYLKEDGSYDAPPAALYFAERESERLTQNLLLKAGFNFPNLEPDPLLDKARDWQHMHISGETPDMEIAYSPALHACRVTVFEENAALCKHFTLDHNRMPIFGLEPLDQRKALDLGTALRNLLHKGDTPQTAPQTKLNL